MSAWGQPPARFLVRVGVRVLHQLADLTAVHVLACLAPAQSQQLTDLTAVHVLACLAPAQSQHGNEPSATLTH